MQIDKENERIEVLRFGNCLDARNSMNKDLEKNFGVFCVDGTWHKRGTRK